MATKGLDALDAYFTVYLPALVTAVVAPLWDQSKDWGDEQWRAVREGIRATDAKDRAVRSA